jgi:hypothetical protein
MLMGAMALHYYQILTASESLELSLLIKLPISMPYPPHKESLHIK